jgi:hypothetical protein
VYKSQGPSGYPAREPWDPAFYIQLGLGVRLSRHVSVGALTSSSGGLSGLSINRYAAEARYHAVRTRAIDLWGGGELGFGLWSYGEACGDCNASPAGHGSHFVPLVGPSLGFDFMLGPYVSLGMESRFVLGAWGSYHGTEHVPAGISPMIFLGFTLGVHLPV